MLLPQRRETFQEATRTPEEIAFFKLKSRQEIWSNQVEELSDKRNELASELRQKNGADLEGAQARLKALDAQLQQAEADLAAVTKEMAAAAPASISEPSTRTIWQGYSEDDLIGAGFGGAAIMFAIFVPFMIRNFIRRRRAGRTGPTTTQVPVIAAERIDRMEQSIDSIAVEIERVSENQRFMTRLMTETQLAGTIAAVRGSTEAARVAAEKASNG
jgi:hypothetical protein